MNNSDSGFCQNEQFKCENKLTNYRCTSCDFETDLQIILKIHIEHNCQTTDFSTTDYICNSCNFTSHSLLVLFKHQSSCTKPPVTLKKDTCGYVCCKFCDYKSPTCKGLKEHYFTNHSNEMYKCDQCSFVTTKECYVRKHASLQHSERRVYYECQHCPYKTKNRKDLKTHILLVHTKPEEIKWFECTQCNYKGKIKTALTSHIRKMHTDRNNMEVHECPKCSFKTFNKSSFNKHLKKHSTESMPYQCDQCLFQAFEKNSLERHIISRHAKPEEIEWFHCDQCEYKGKHRYALYLHKGRIHSEKKYQCTRCSYNTPYPKRLKAHSEKHDVKRNQTYRFKCSWCLFKTNYKTTLDSHFISKHTEALEIDKWQECDKAKVEKTLKSHIRRVHKDN